MPVRRLMPLTSWPALHLGGVISSVATQTGPPGFEDVTIGVELPDGTNARVHAQCRHRQQLTGVDTKFKALLGHAWSADVGSPISIRTFVLTGHAHDE